MKGIIALDIDGTITTECHEISPEVIAYFNSLAVAGWRFIFITGRTFQWGFDVVRLMPFPCHFAVQNGAIIFSMPEQKIVAKKYITSSIFPLMEKICDGEPSDFVVFAGYEYDDKCFFRPRHFEASLLDYIHQRAAALKEVWIPLNSYSELPLLEFASVKCFGQHESAIRIAQRIEELLGLHVPLIRDPFNHFFYVIQATHPQTNKGAVVKDFKNMSGISGPVIAAGDDNNDISMLEMADVKIVMQTAPQPMLLMADLIAPPAVENGIIQGLEQAIMRCR